MCTRIVAALLSALTAALLAFPAPAAAIPAFARKYETSCLTCHSVYPRLTPFGEAVRRNGYRFPGIDGDYVKQPAVVMGQEANKKTFPSSVWPSSIPASVPLAIGAVALCLFLTAAWRGNGYSQSDEWFQTVELASFRLGRTPAAALVPGSTAAAANRTNEARTRSPSAPKATILFSGDRRKRIAMAPPRPRKKLSRYTTQGPVVCRNPA